MALTLSSQVRLDVEVTMTQGAGRVSQPFTLIDLSQNEALMVLEDTANYASARIVARRTK